MDNVQKKIKVHHELTQLNVLPSEVTKIIRAFSKLLIYQRLEELCVVQIVLEKYSGPDVFSWECFIS